MSWQTASHILQLLGELLMICLEIVCKELFGTCSGLKGSYKIYVRNVSLNYARIYIMCQYTVIRAYMSNIHYYMELCYYMELPLLLNLGLWPHCLLNHWMLQNWICSNMSNMHYMHYANHKYKKYAGYAIWIYMNRIYMQYICNMYIYAEYRDWVIFL